MPKPPKRPRDPNQLAKLIVDIAAGEVVEEPASPPKSSLEAAREGGRVGGPARSRALTPERRAEIAKKAAQTRWATASEREKKERL